MRVFKSMVGAFEFLVCVSSYLHPHGFVPSPQACLPLMHLVEQQRNARSPVAFHPFHNSPVPQGGLYGLNKPIQRLLNYLLGDLGLPLPVALRFPEG